MLESQSPAVATDWPGGDNATEVAAASPVLVEFPVVPTPSPPASSNGGKRGTAAEDRLGLSAQRLGHALSLPGSVAP